MGNTEVTSCVYVGNAEATSCVYVGNACCLEQQDIRISLMLLERGKYLIKNDSS